MREDTRVRRGEVYTPELVHHWGLVFLLQRGVLGHGCRAYGRPEHHFPCLQAQGLQYRDPRSVHRRSWMAGHQFRQRYERCHVRPTQTSSLDACPAYGTAVPGSFTVSSGSPHSPLSSQSRRRWTRRIGAFIQNPCFGAPIRPTTL